MIRRFFADGLCWMVLFGALVGVAVYGLYFTPPDTTTIVWEQP